LDTVATASALHARLSGPRQQGARVGFVPTMGFLHRGHAALIEQARQRCDVLVVSIFVNPRQFGPSEDLDRYPRDLAGDSKLCHELGVDVLFTPERFYDRDHATVVSVAGLSDGLCGAARPGHFDGVTTVVARLFGMVQPHFAVFGEKDWQQLAVVRRMVRDLAMPVEVVGAPLVRDPDGLALSSRNVFLSPDQRRRALSLSRALRLTQDRLAAGERQGAPLLALASSEIDADRTDYISIVGADDLQPVDRIDGPSRLLVAAFYGATRLIDNVALTPAGGLE
jgi:pantoate--beta-alanine ligase